MSVPKFKRKPSGLEYVDNSYELKSEIMNLCSKLSARWARIYQQPIDRLACLQADLVNMAFNINPTNYEEYITRRTLLKLSNACLCALEKRVMDMVRVLYTNPSKCFNRKNGKNYTYGEAIVLLDKRMENLGIMYQKQYDLLKGVISSDKKKFDKLYKEDYSDKELFDLVVSKVFGLLIQ